MAAGADSRVLAARPRIPDHVVTRGFGDESVALNLESGQYHGLNGVAAHMFEGLRSATTVGAAVAPLAAEFGQPPEVIERDLVALVRGLHERGLIELDDDGRN
jgi:coenzyme PQQ synthesis protein D (PqqD)